MRKLFGFVAAAALALGVSAPAQAAPVSVNGSIAIVVGTLPPLGLPIPTTTVDVTGGTLTIPAGIAATAGLFVPVTGFPLNLITGIVVTAMNAGGTFFVPGPADGGAASIPGGGFGGKMPIIGVVQVKGALAINVPISNVGAGGSVSAGGIVVEGAPWTTGLAKVTTTGAPMAMFAQSGSQSGVLGAASSTTVLVTPAHVNAAGLARLPVFAIATLHFIPEPGTALLLGAGLAGLVALGRKRMSK
jgi:hypothetical protein